MLTLYSAADILTGPGCPVCRYATEASDRYLGWFALEGHADAGYLSVLRASLGTCARHTRLHMSQPGASVRLTAVYRYVLTAARDQLAGRATPVQPCPACEHARAAAGRAAETLADGLADGEVMDRCRQLGGVCIPHMRTAAASAPRHIVTWLADTLREAASAPTAGSGWLAGADRDAEARAVLRHEVPPSGTPLPGACVVCLAAAQAERDCLAGLAGPARREADAGPGLAVCAEHLADLAASAATPGRLRAMLAWQANCLIAQTQQRVLRGPGWARWLRPGGKPDRSPGCRVCQARTDAQVSALARLTAAIGSSQPPEPGSRPLCVRHVLRVRGLDRPAAHVLVTGSLMAADV